MAYIGRDTDKISNVEVLDNITFDGSSSYTLQKGGSNFTPSSANTLLLSIDGVVQAGNFTVSGSTIDFGAAVAGTSTCDFILHYGVGLITAPSDGTVTTAKLADSSVTTGKLSGALVTPSTLDVNGNELILDADADTSITADTDDRIDVKIGGTDRIQFNSDGGIKVINTPPIKSFDFSTAVTIADGGSITFSATSGTWLITEQAQTGQTAIYIAGGGTISVVGQTGSSYLTANTGTGFRFYSTGSAWKFKNSYGATCSFGFCHISTRAST